MAPRSEDGPPLNNRKRRPSFVMESEFSDAETKGKRSIKRRKSAASLSKQPSPNTSATPLKFVESGYENMIATVSSPHSPRNPELQQQSPEQMRSPKPLTPLSTSARKGRKAAMGTSKSEQCVERDDRLRLSLSSSRATCLKLSSNHSSPAFQTSTISTPKIATDASPNFDTSQPIECSKLELISAIKMGPLSLKKKVLDTMHANIHMSSMAIILVLGLLVASRHLITTIFPPQCNSSSCSTISESPSMFRLLSSSQDSWLGVKLEHSPLQLHEGLLNAEKSYVSHDTSHSTTLIKSMTHRKNDSSFLVSKDSLTFMARPENTSFRVLHNSNVSVAPVFTPQERKELAEQLSKLISMPVPQMKGSEVVDRWHNDFSISINDYTTVHDGYVESRNENIRSNVTTESMAGDVKLNIMKAIQRSWLARVGDDKVLLRLKRRHQCRAATLLCH